MRRLGTQVRRAVAAASVLGMVAGGMLAAWSPEASAAVPSTLFAGTSLAPGQSLSSPGGQYVLTMQRGGDLVETTGGLGVWSTGTHLAGSSVTLEADGNLVVEAPGGRSLWWSATWGHRGAALSVSRSGVLAITAGSTTVWRRVAPDLLRPGQTLLRSWSVVSDNGLYTLVMRADGNLSEFLTTPQRMVLLWRIRGGGPGAHAALQRDGNLVLYTAGGRPVWSTGTWRDAGARLVVRDNAQMQLIGGRGRVLWSSHSTSLRTAIVTVADSQLGYADTPAGTFCNAFSAYWGSGARCGGGLRSEAWCADFAAWVWRRAGVRFTYAWEPGDLSASAASFYSWAVAHRHWHPARSGYVPQPGDVAVFGLNRSGSYAEHVAVVVTAAPSGIDAINGDWWWAGNGGVGWGTDEGSTSGAGPISGYASP